jgi:hypothetical protein
VDAAWIRPDLNGSSRRDSYSGSSLLKYNNEQKYKSFSPKIQTTDIWW